MRLLSILVSAFLSIVPLAALAADAPPERESAFDRILRTNTIRCGYLVAPPAIIKDANTGAMSGVMVDYLEALGSSLGLKVVWSEEMNLATYLQDLNNGRYDLECSGGWPNALRGKQVGYSTPIFYFPFYAVVRIDDHRFDHNYSALNKKNVRIVAHDGSSEALIRDRQFPSSTYVSLAGSAPLSDSLFNVITHKADVTFVDYSALLTFEQNNPGKLRKVDGPPVRIIPTNISFASGEYRLQQMINTATQELLYDGVIDRILSKYELAPGAYLRVAAPYAAPTGE